MRADRLARWNERGDGDDFAVADQAEGALVGADQIAAKAYDRVGNGRRRAVGGCFTTDSQNGLQDGVGGWPGCLRLRHVTDQSDTRRYAPSPGDAASWGRLPGARASPRHTR